MNSVTLLGNTTRDAEFKVSERGAGVLKFGLATNKKYKNSDGELVEDVQFHNCVLFGKRAESLSQHLAKGTKLLVQGELRYGSYEKDGVKRYTTDIVVNEVEFCGGGKRSDSAGADSSSSDSSSSDGEDVPF